MIHTNKNITVTVYLIFERPRYMKYRM